MQLTSTDCGCPKGAVPGKSMISRHITQHPHQLLHFSALRFTLLTHTIATLHEMPKCEIDPTLQEQLRLFLSENRLSVSGAAAKLGVGRTTLWRFYHSGRARGDTRALYREALAQCRNGAADAVADVAFDANTGQFRRVLLGGSADLELKRIRKTCETVLALLDVYETQASGR